MADLEMECVSPTILRPRPATVLATKTHFVADCKPNLIRTSVPAQPRILELASTTSQAPPAQGKYTTRLNRPSPTVRMPFINISLTASFGRKANTEIDELTLAQETPLPGDEPIASLGVSPLGLLSECSRTFGNTVIGYCLIIANHLNKVFATTKRPARIADIVNFIPGYYRIVANYFTQVFLAVMFQYTALTNNLTDLCHLMASHDNQVYRTIRETTAEVLPMILSTTWNSFMLYLTTFLVITTAILFSDGSGAYDYPTSACEIPVMAPSPELPVEFVNPPATSLTADHLIILSQLHQDLDLMFLKIQVSDSSAAGRGKFCLPSISIAGKQFRTDADHNAVYGLSNCQAILEIQDKDYEDLLLPILWTSSPGPLQQTPVITTPEFLRKDFAENLLPRYFEILLKIGAILEHHPEASLSSRSSMLIASAATLLDTSGIEHLEPSRVFDLTEEKTMLSDILSEWEEKILGQAWLVLRESWNVMEWVKSV